MNSVVHDDHFTKKPFGPEIRAERVERAERRIDCEELPRIQTQHPAWKAVAKAS